MGNLLTDLIDRAVMAVDDDYDPQDYAWERYQKALRKERQLRNFAEMKREECERLLDRYDRRPSYDLEAEIIKAQREYEKAREEYLRARRATDKRQNEYINSNSRGSYYTEPKYHPDERVRIEEVTGEYEPELLYEKVGRWMDDALRRRPWRS